MDEVRRRGHLVHCMPLIVHHSKRRETSDTFWYIILKSYFRMKLWVVLLVSNMRKLLGPASSKCRSSTRLWRQENEAHVPVCAPCWNPRNKDAECIRVQDKKTFWKEIFNACNKNSQLRDSVWWLIHIARNRYSGWEWVLILLCSNVHTVPSQGRNQNQLFPVPVPVPLLCSVNKPKDRLIYS